jgi:DNA-directed RNA polymerase subunit M/transcription elongation factor TFIIS
MSLLDHMCPKCDYYMPMGQQVDPETELKDVIRYCRNCGHTKEENKGLVMEVIVQQKSTETQQVFVNEFTKHDPRLPHVKTLKCPNLQCPSRQTQGVEPDVIYIKYDTANLKFLYICNHCETKWRSRS